MNKRKMINMFPSLALPCGLTVGDFPPIGCHQHGACAPVGDGGGGPSQPSMVLLGTGRSLAPGRKASPRKGKKGKKTPGKPKRKPRRQGSRAQVKGKEAESGQLLCASYNADRLTKASLVGLCVELEARGVLVCAIQDHGP